LQLQYLRTALEVLGVDHRDHQWYVCMYMYYRAVAFAGTISRSSISRSSISRQRTDCGKSRDQQRQRMWRKAEDNAAEMRQMKSGTVHHLKLNFIVRSRVV
jgi:hypothetical protein